MATRVRRTDDEVAGQTEAVRLVTTLGQQVRSARRAMRITLRALAKRVGISTTRLSEIERGLGGGAPIATWISLGIALERPLAVSLSKALGEPGTPVDAGHLEIQEYVLALAKTTGRYGTFELPTRPSDPTRSADVGIRDVRNRARVLAECWNTFGDLGAAVRATHRKAAEAAATWPAERVTTVWVIRATAANRAIMARYPHILAAAFPGSSRRWVQALTNGAVQPPHEPGIVWFDPATGRLTEHRRATIAA